MRSILRGLTAAWWTVVACSSEGDGDADTDASSSGMSGASPTTSATEPTDASITDAASSDASTATGDSSGGATAVTDGDSTGGGPPQPSPGCGNPAPVGAAERMIEVASVPRIYTLAIPDPYDPEVPHPLVFGFHGLGGSGAGYYIPAD